MGNFYSKIRNLSSHADTLLAVGILSLILLLIVPIPPFLLDCLLCFSIIFSVMILLLTIYVENALEFSAFPTLLLFMTLYRLGLNLAATRMILTHGEGGDIIRTFGACITGGNIVVGCILFLLLTMVNFIVVTKGSGRIAEVAARFTLEALPGKQLAIDGELANGSLSQDEAMGARAKISQESDFYGAMDGASKFIRGDAIAGLVMIVVNIFGGFIIGMTMQGLEWESCISLFTRLTIGEGLVSQLPALLVSVGAGIMVTRASSGSLGKTLPKQMFYHPKVLLIGGVIILVLGMVPGMPLLVMLPISLLFLIGAYSQFKSERKEEVSQEAETLLPLFVHPIAVELSVELTYLTKPLRDRLLVVRKEVAIHLGIRLPTAQIIERKELAATHWNVRIKGVVVASGKGADLQSLSRAVKGVLESHAHELLTRQDVAQMIHEVKRYDSAVVEELVGKKLAIGHITKVLHHLLKEGVPIRDFVTILELLADHAKTGNNDLEMLAEMVRNGLSQGISEAFFGKTGVAHVILLDPHVEQVIDVSHGNMRPAIIEKLLRTLRDLTEKATQEGHPPVLVTEAATRIPLKRLIEKSFPKLPVLAYREITDEIACKRVGLISNDVLV